MPKSQIEKHMAAAYEEMEYQLDQVIIKISICHYISFIIYKKNTGVPKWKARELVRLL